MCKELKLSMIAVVMETLDAIVWTMELIQVPSKGIVD